MSIIPEVEVEHLAAAIAAREAVSALYDRARREVNSRITELTISSLVQRIVK